jgi:ABC-2 type transport system ATP-binding protein
MWNAVRNLRHEGITVVLTTHYMEEADELCERVAIIDHGKILVQDSPAALKNSAGAETLYALDLRRTEGAEQLAARVRQMNGISSVEITPDGIRVFAQNADGLLSGLVHEANAYGLRDLRITEPSLETVFIRLTGRDLRE